MSDSSSAKKRSSVAKPKMLNASQNHPLKAGYVPKRALNGRAEPIRELSQGAKNVMEYASGIHATTRHLGRNDMPDQVLNHLQLGSESMHRTRESLNRGRANVHEDRDKFPEARYRTQVGYSKYTSDTAKFASVAELMRAGNCDMHAAVNYTYIGGKMGKDSVAAKVVDPVAKHTFAELRASSGATTTAPSDVIVDSWTSGKHAVLRRDTTFGEEMSPTRTDKSKNFTETTTTSATGKTALQRKQSLVAKGKKFQADHDKAAKLPANRIKPKNPSGMYSESPILSKAGAKRVKNRDAILQAGKVALDPQKPLGGILRDLQRVQVARKMGASIGGAAKYVNTNK